MPTAFRIRKLNQDYEERIYAGLLGQAIGAGLGRHHLGDLRTIPGRELGKIGYDISTRGDFSSAFVNDNIVTGLTSARVLEDFGYSSSFGSEQIAQTWLNYAIENRTVLCWSGMGHSANHTAYLHLKNGIPAPISGSIEASGAVVAEQSGSEASAPVWGMLSPCDTERAVEMAGKAARVASDGEAVYATQAVAAMVSAAFSPGTSLDAIVASAELALPKECAMARLIADIREWHQSGEAWQHIRERVLEKYGGSAFDERHAVPHAAGVYMALLLGNNELSKSLALIAAAGWGTAANLSIIGCILGVKNSLPGIDLCPAWRAAIDDIIFLPSADTGHCVSDLVTEALAIARMGRELQRLPVVAPKKGARFHFEMAGCTQGFIAEMSTESPGLAMLRNLTGHSRAGKHALAVVFSGVDAQRSARVSAAVFPKREKLPNSIGGSGPFMHGCPTLYPGQTIRAYVETNSENKQQVGVRPFIRYFGEHDELCLLRGPEKVLLPDARHEFQWTLPHAIDPVNLDGTQVLMEGFSRDAHHTLLLGRPIAEVGLEIFSDKPCEGVVYLDYLTWDGTPRVELGPPDGSGTVWRHAWVSAAHQHAFGKGAASMRVCQNSGTGLLIQGSRTWRDYTALANVTPRMARSAGIAVRVQGQQRYYALVLCAGNKARLIKKYYGISILAEIDFNWSFGQTIELSLSAEGNRLIARANGRELFRAEDSMNPLDGGAVALLIEEGCLESAAVRISPNE